MTKKRLTIATRESVLAIAQATIVKNALENLHPELTVDLLGITTVGDRRLDVTLSKIGGKGLFVKELEQAICDGKADIAVHSMKDVPMELPPGFSIPAICKREDPRDALITNIKGVHDVQELPKAARLGSSSLRRQAQIALIRPDLNFLNLRGNVLTRLQRLDEGAYDAIILATAGLRRLGLEDRICHYLDVQTCLPAAGQGAIGIECQSHNEAVRALIEPLNDISTAQCVNAERALCRHIGGGCSVPIAAYATVEDQIITLQGNIAAKNGSAVIRTLQIGPANSFETLGHTAAEELLAQGANELLATFIDT